MSIVSEASIPRPDCGRDPRFDLSLPMRLASGGPHTKTKYTILADEYVALKRDAARLDWIQAHGKIDLDSRDGCIRSTIDYLMQHNPSPKSAAATAWPAPTITTCEA